MVKRKTFSQPLFSFHFFLHSFYHDGWVVCGARKFRLGHVGYKFTIVRSGLSSEAYGKFVIVVVGGCGCGYLSVGWLVLVGVVGRQAGVILVLRIVMHSRTSMV